MARHTITFPLRLESFERYSSCLWGALRSIFNANDDANCHPPCNIQCSFKALQISLHRRSWFVQPVDQKIFICEFSVRAGIGLRNLPHLRNTSAYTILFYINLLFFFLSDALHLHLEKIRSMTQGVPWVCPYSDWRWVISTLQRESR